MSRNEGLQPRKASETTALQTARDDRALRFGLELIRQEGALLDRCLPAGIAGQRFKAAVATAFRANPELAECSVTSLKLAIVKAALTGVELGDEVYLIPYAKAASCQLGYLGWCQLLRRSGEILDITGRHVYAGDTFALDYGGVQPLIHAVARSGLRGEREGAYVRIRLQNGGQILEYMTCEEIEAHRARYAKKGLTSAWKDSRPGMELKTVLLQAKRWAPRSRDLPSGERAEDVTAPAIHPETGEVLLPGLPAEPILEEAVPAEAPPPAPGGSTDPDGRPEPREREPGEDG